MDDLQRFRDTFITECFELLGDMEERLMGLDAANASREELDAIFRCAHSIKGGAGAFGFTAITQFTHILEALLDLMRESKITPTREVVDTLLKSRDIVLQMVTAARDGTALPEGYGADVAKELQSYSSGQAAAAAPAAKAQTAAAPAGMTRYRITFTPSAGMLSHGNEPLLLLRELKKLGAAQIACDLSRLPALRAINFEDSYMSWTIALATDKPVSAIKEVFEFVEDECTLTIAEDAPTQAAPVDEAHAPASEAVVTRAAAAPAEKSSAPASAAAGQPQVSSIRVDIDKVDRLINMVGEVVIIQAMLAAQTRTMSDQEFPELTRGIGELLQHTRELQEAVMAIRMQPVKSIFSRMPRIVRDLSTQLGKDIVLETEGETTEVDKTIIEQLSDPLTHMIRNSVDHGIEKPDDRLAKGKPAQGTITLSAQHRGGRIIIEIADDGAGIPREKVLKKAREKGLVAADVTPTNSEIDNLIFAPGFSTAEQVTNVSGRGVGMDVVKRNIEGIGGTVFVQTTPGQGSRFTISLPLTLAILDGMIVRVAGEYYIIPINNIVETLRPKQEDVQSIADGNAVINVRGSFVPVLYLHRLFGIQGAIRDASKGLVVLVENGAAHLGLVVDELVGQQQVVIKSLEENSDPIEGVSGATILGDGKVSLILDIASLARMKHLPDPDAAPLALAA